MVLTGKNAIVSTFGSPKGSLRSVHRQRCLMSRITAIAADLGGQSLFAEVTACSGTVTAGLRPQGEPVKLMTCDQGRIHLPAVAGPGADVLASNCRIGTEIIRSIHGRGLFGLGASSFAEAPAPASGLASGLYGAMGWLRGRGPERERRVVRYGGRRYGALWVEQQAFSARSSGAVAPGWSRPPLTT